MLLWIWKQLMRVARRRQPVFIGGKDDPYLIRWHILPRNRWCNLYVHLFLRSDDDRALHDHPWWSASLMLVGSYVEHDANGSRIVQAGQVRFRSARYAHRIELLDGDPCWTMFITGPRIREWGFWCPWGWRHWREFTEGPNGELVGKGCD